MDDKQKRRRKRKQKKQSGRKAFTAASPPTKPLELPPMFAMEQIMRSMFGGGGGAGDDRAEAQDLAYEAMEAPMLQQRLTLAKQALELNPRCVDALLVVATWSGARGDELIELVRDAVRAGEEDLGPEVFREERGQFWGILETRPYMRARAQLAERLAASGRLEEAVEHLEDMLDLNPDDNQGLRYVLLGHYLALDRPEDARELFSQYKEEAGAFFAWAKVLERFLSGDQPAARQALQEARRSNPFAEAYLSGRKPLPRQLPEYYGIGDENEGIVCAVEIGEAWRRHPDAVAWLKASK